MLFFDSCFTHVVGVYVNVATNRTYFFGMSMFVLDYLLGSIFICLSWLFLIVLLAIVFDRFGSFFTGFDYIWVEINFFDRSWTIWENRNDRIIFYIFIESKETVTGRANNTDSFDHLKARHNELQRRNLTSVELQWIVNSSFTFFQVRAKTQFLGVQGLCNELNVRRNNECAVGFT